MGFAAYGGTDQQGVSGVLMRLRFFRAGPGEGEEPTWEIIVVEEGVGNLGPTLYSLHERSCSNYFRNGPLIEIDEDVLEILSESVDVEVTAIVPPVGVETQAPKSVHGASETKRLDACQDTALRSSILVAGR